MLLIPEEELVQLENDEFYIHHLVGMKVYDEEDTLLGTVTDVVQNISGDIFVMKSPDNIEVLIPAVKDFVREVSREKNRITIRVIEGLLDVNENN
jgi:16S rRNA processing protein RimM